MRFRAPRPAEVEINLTSLIDILFIVLLFLVVTASYTEQGALRVSLPRASSSEPRVPDPARMRIVVEADGTARIDDREQTLEEIRERLRALKAADGGSVTVAADARARHGRVIEIVDLVRHEGLSALDIETLAEPVPAR